jgi:hypothetical protein
MGMTSLIRLIRPIGMTLLDLCTHEADLLGMSRVRTSSQSHMCSAATRHRANGRSSVKRARTGGDPAASIQTGHPMTPRIAEFDPVPAFDGPTGEKKWAIMTISRE